MQRRQIKYRTSTFTIAAFALFVSLQTFGQNPIPIGQWRTHYPSAGTHSVEEVDNKVYCASTIALYYFDKIDESVHVFSKKDGLSGTDITKLGSYKSKDLLIGYSDGNIDILSPDNISQFDAIQRSTIEGSKAIHHFWIQGDFAFVSTDYGMSVINLNKKEVTDSYINISSDGTANPFYGSVLSSDGDSIFVVSQKGVMAARFSSGVNLKDYSNWTLYGVANGLPVGANNAIGRLNNSIFVGVNDNGLYYFNGSTWQVSSITGTTGFELKSIESQVGFMMVTVDAKIYKVFSSTSANLFSGAGLIAPNDVLSDSKGELWISDRTFGLVHYVAGTFYTTTPNGPYTTDIYRLKYINNTIAGCPGGLSSSFGPLFIDAGYMFYTSEQIWKNNNRYESFPDTRDILDIAYQPNRSKWFFSSFGYGLIEWDGALFNVYTKTNSPLKSNQVSGLGTSTDGTVWVGNTSQNLGDPFLFSIDKTGIWRSYFPFQNAGKYPLDIVVDLLSNKWIRLATSGGVRGLMMFNEKTNSQIYFNITNGSGALPTTSVNAIEVDKNGQVWIGMDQGVGVFTNPAGIKPGNIPNIYLPIVAGFPLFFDKKINCIKTDGGNRKWIGTTDGAFLLSEDGLETILNFNTTNSPLTNDNIVSITIDEQSGEVFFASERGIVSYRGDATTGTTAHEDVKVFPNPVLPDFDGEVGISGLADNARVKITDIAGKLVFDTKANGATATWNLHSYSGRRAAAGVYLIFSATEDGVEKFVGKMAILE